MTTAAIIHFVAAAPGDPSTPKGFGSGTISAARAHRVAELAIHPIRRDPFRMLLNPEGARALGYALIEAVDSLQEADHA